MKRMEMVLSGETVLTGITTSGTPHIGNYVGAIRPSVVASEVVDAKFFSFLQLSLIHI